MTRVTIKKMKQPSDSRSLKEGKKFYRVKRDGVTVQDFKKKSTASKYANKLRKKYER